MRLIYIFLNQGTGFPVGGGSREESNTVDIGGEEALAASCIIHLSAQAALDDMRLLRHRRLGLLLDGAFHRCQRSNGWRQHTQSLSLHHGSFTNRWGTIGLRWGSHWSYWRHWSRCSCWGGHRLGTSSTMVKKNNAYGIMGSLSWCFFRTILYKCISVDYILNPLTPPCANFKLIRFSSFASSSLAENDSTDGADLDRSSHIHSFWKGKCTNWHHLSQFGWEK